MLFAFVLAFIASTFLSFVLRPSLSDEEGKEDINPLFKIIQLFSLPPATSSFVRNESSLLGKVY